MTKRILSSVAALLMAGCALGADAWAFRFNAKGGGSTVRWHDDLVFHNTTALDAIVHLVGVSNGELAEGSPSDVTVPAGRTVSLTDLFGVWEPLDYEELYIVHFEVSDGVLAFSRGGAGGECPSPCGMPPNPYPNLGAFGMPVFHALVAAGQAQIHMGADLGTEPGRINVGIYNAGASDAKATIEVFQACDDTVLETRTVSVPPNTAVQFGGIGFVQTHCGSNTPLNTWLRYATVMVDQPSLSYIVNLAEPLPGFPTIVLSVPSGF